MLKEFFADDSELHTREIELAAIWLEKPLQTATDRTVRITEGHEVKVIDGKLVDCLDGKPTHRVIGCCGTVRSTTLSFILLDLETNQPFTLKIK